MRICLVGFCLLLWPAIALGQFTENAVSENGPQLSDAITSRVKVGVIIKASSPVFRAVATVPVPGNWPEQQVEIVSEDISSAVHSVTYRDLTGGGGMRQMVVQVPQLPAGQEARALVTFEVTRHGLAAPVDTSIYQVPKKLPRQLRINIGPSPYIESRHPRIIKAAKQAASADQPAWQKVESLYNWTRQNVVYKNGKLKGAARAVIDGEGYTDAVTSLFIAMCRVHKIPARTVFIKGHCYAEFYLEDDQGEGHWFPCRPAGERAFGEIDAGRPILQKGDSFKNPENTRERLRWVKEYFHASGRGKAPKVRFVHQTVAE